MSDKPTPLLPLFFSASTFMKKQQAPFFLYFLVPSSASHPFSAEPQEIGSQSQPSSSCNTELTLNCGPSPTPTETQISSASMKRKLSSEFSSSARKRACSVEPEEFKNSQKNWGYSQRLMLYDDPWKIKKILTQSDVDESCRLLMPKDVVEELVLPMLDSKSQRNVAENGIPVVFWDAKDESEHRLTLKLWPSTKCYVFVDGWKRNFVNRRMLKKGDEIGLHWDPYKRRFDFTVFSKAV